MIDNWSFVAKPGRFAFFIEGSVVSKSDQIPNASIARPMKNVIGR
jgi:hypothetical protein